jgi:hypothetical protein
MRADLELSAQSSLDDEESKEPGPMPRIAPVERRCVARMIVGVRGPGYSPRGGTEACRRRRCRNAFWMNWAWSSTHQHEHAASSYRTPEMPSSLVPQPPVVTSAPVWQGGGGAVIDVERVGPGDRLPGGGPRARGPLAAPAVGRGPHRPLHPQPPGEACYTALSGHLAT